MAQHSCTVLPAAHYGQLRSAHLHAPDLPSSLSDMRLSSRKAWSGPPANDPTSFPGRSFILDGHSLIFGGGADECISRFRAYHFSDSDSVRYWMDLA